MSHEKDITYVESCKNCPKSTANYINAVKIELSSRITVENDLLNLYALLVMTKGASCTWEDVHNAWSIWRNETDPKHRSIVPFDELTYEVQEMDKDYAEAIIKTAQILDI